METQANSMSAWVETIRTFIKESISAGQDLGKSVTKTINKFQTALAIGGKISINIYYFDVLY